MISAQEESDSEGNHRDALDIEYQRLKTINRAVRGRESDSLGGSGPECGDNDEEDGEEE